MKPLSFLLISISILLYSSSTIHALSPEEQANVAALRARQAAEIRAFRKDAIDVFRALDSSLDIESATKQANKIVLRGLGFSVSMTVADPISRTIGKGTLNVKVYLDSYNEGAVKVLVGLFASLGIHTDDDVVSKLYRPLKDFVLIPGADPDAYSGYLGPPCGWKWAEQETLSLLATKPTVFQPTAARVKELLKRDRSSAIDYITRHYKKTKEAAEYFVNQVIPNFEGEESCPKKGAFIGSTFFIQLLDDTDRRERNDFIEDLFDRIFPPSEADSIVDSSGQRVEPTPVTYYLFKAAYEKILFKRSRL